MLVCPYPAHAGSGHSYGYLSRDSMRVEQARGSDLAGIRWLLECERLPTSDLNEHSLEGFLVCRDGIGVMGAVALEVFESVALLRSLVVDREMRGEGIGSQLTKAAEALARRSGVQSIYLLTTTADEFFRRRGYRIIARCEAPVAIQSTALFSQLCPSSAVLMVKP